MTEAALCGAATVRDVTPITLPASFLAIYCRHHRGLHFCMAVEEIDPQAEV